jgi:GntR family transcriptional regulator
MPFSFRVTSGDRVPIYLQIVEQARHAIAHGKLQPGEALPSIRTLAEDLLVNPNTVAKAYTELAREGFVDVRRGKGMVVADRPPRSPSSGGDVRLKAILSAFLEEAFAQGLSPNDVRAAVEAALNRLEKGDEAQ